jgi:hypothetical protein
MYDYMRPRVTWQTSVTGARVVIERLEIPNGSVLTDATWVEAVHLSDKPWPCTDKCAFIESDARPMKVSGTEKYRVTIVEPAPSTRRSEPVTTEEIFLSYQPMAPNELHDVAMVKGESQQLAFRPSDPKAQYLTSDPNIVSIWSPGVIKAVDYGKANVTAVSMESGGAIKFWLWRVSVSSPQ